ncbi:MAG TPA: ABC transporter permease subunit [Streptosporangiaceae bacterium]|jgi:ABC-type transport system involved in multi-copper enzyme maturation permease subunit
MTAVTDRAPARPDRDGFGQLLHAEWTKFRTVRGWVIGMIVAALASILVGLLAAGSANIGCRPPGGPVRTGRACLPAIPVGPGGEAVTDSFYFVRQQLARHGSITVRISGLSGRYGGGGGPAGASAAGGGAAGMTPGLQPWSKAGIIIAASTRPGAAYAAMMATGRHGVRLQWDYTHDTAGLPGAVSAAAPRWLRLTRSGDTLTGYDSADGAHWTQVGTVTLPGLAGTVPAGLFAASPLHLDTTAFFGGSRGQSSGSEATAVFDHVVLRGGQPGARWTGGFIGGGQRAPYPLPAGGYRQAGDVLTVTGSGDIAPDVTGAGSTFPSTVIEDHLVGIFAGLIAVVVVAAMFMTAEYRRGLIRITLAASPRRGRVLAAKAVIVGGTAFAAGLVASIISVTIGTRLASAQGMYVLPVSLLTQIRVVAGTAALLAVAAVLALAIGALLRRTAAAVAVGIVVIVLPFILGVASVLPAGAAEWLLRLTPAAGFAIQQSLPAYAQVGAPYSPAGGYYPLAPWAGFAVLCGYAALALTLAIVLLRRRDA